MKMARRRNILWIALIALALALAPACSDDGTSEANNNTLTDTGSDSTDEPDAPSDGGPDGGQDVSDSGDDASDADPTQDADATSNDATDGGDEDAGDTSDATDEPDAPHTGCAYPPVDASCPDGPHGPGSFMTEFVFKERGECCHDYDGDGIDDNALGDLVAQLAGPPAETDFNEVIDYQIQNGVLVYLFEYAYWSDENNDASLELDLLFGRDTDADFAPNLAGTGDFYIEPDSLDANGDPRSNFPSASVSNGRLSVSGGSAPLSLPVGTELIEVDVTDIVIEADVVPGADFEAGGRVELTNGQLAGLVTLDELFGALNDVARNCSCIATDPVFTENSTDTWVCNSTPEDAESCNNDPNATLMCQNLADTTAISGCSIIASVLSNSPDLDRDGDDSNETLSLGATFEAVGAEITGVAP